MEGWDLVRSNAPLPALSFVMSMLLLLLAKRGRVVMALTACAAPAIALGTYAWWRDWDTAIVPFALFFGLIPGGVLAIGIRLWCSADRSRSTVKALVASAGCGVLPCLATFYAFI